MWRESRYRLSPCISVYPKNGLGLKRWVMTCFIVIRKQGGLRREKYPGEAGGLRTRGGARVWARRTDGVLGAHGITLEGSLGARWHVNVRGVPVAV